LFAYLRLISKIELLSGDNIMNTIEITNRGSISNTFRRSGYQIQDIAGRDVMKLATELQYSVTKVAKTLGMTAYQLKAALEKAVGLAPKEFFRNYRALQARRMISDGVPLGEISNKLGFRYYTHFAAEIRSYYGVPPRDLQRMLQKVEPLAGIQLAN
jgi:AraC-like DNA-binding protein